MKNYKLVLQYDGSSYDGWQRQSNTSHSIQAVLEKCLSDCLGETVCIQGSGRTDKGVHALGQTVHLKLSENNNLNTEQIETIMRKNLPESIGLVSLEEVAMSFHSRYDVKSKIYEYRVRTGSKASVFTRKYEYWLGQELCLTSMKVAAAYLIGRHDFSSFTSDKDDCKNKIRLLTDISIRREGDLYVLRFQGEGFLYNMVRIMAGTLIEVGLKKREPEAIKGILTAKNRDVAGFTAPASGLFLMQVDYG